MSWLSSFLHPGKGYEKAQEQLDKSYGQSQGLYNQAQSYQQPFYQHGQEQYGNLNELIKSLMDPEALQNKWVSGYAESPSAIQAEKMAQEHGLNAASSMGLTGSNTALNAIQSGTSQIGMEDRQNYLNDLMKKYLSGAGLVQDAYGTGANAANNMSNAAMNQGQNAMNFGQNSAGMSYGKQNAPGELFGKMAGGASKLLIDYLTGGMGTGGFGRGAWSPEGG